MENKSNRQQQQSIYFKCSQPSVGAVVASRRVDKYHRSKRQLIGTGELVNFTEVDLPDNFMEAE